MVAVQLSVLGPIAVTDATTGADIPVSRNAQRRVLAILALSIGRRCSTDALIDRMWSGEPPERARGALQTHISALRRRLPDGVIVTEGSGYVLDPSSVELDTDQLARLAAAAIEHHRVADWQRLLDVATAAQSLREGEPFEDLADDGFAEPARAAATEHRELLGELAIEALVRLGRPAEALPMAEATVRRHPFRERGWALLVHARAGLGRYAEALRVVQDARRSLAEAGLEPGPELAAAERHVLDALASDAAPRRHNLPTPISSFVGRRAELTTLRSTLSTERLVTLTGAGGVGKTRLALEAGHELIQSDDVDEYWLVELVGERDDDLVLTRIAGTLGVPADADPGTTVALVERRLRGRRVAILLDNCEHLLDGAARAAQQLLGAAPTARVLATSRAPLGIAGEFVLDVPPLRLPDSTTSPGASEAVLLFAERARRSPPADLELVGKICRSLDGLPLAIELAAGQVWSLGLEALSERVSGPLSILATANAAVPDHHRTMEAAIGWSFELLDDAERELLESLSVFRGPVDLDTIEAVSGRGDLARSIDRLVTHSLVVAVHGADRTRYRLLETVRSFASRRCSRPDALADAHLRHFARRCGEWRVFWMQPPERRIQPTAARWWDDAGLPVDDIRAALDRAALAGIPSGEVDLAGLLAHVAAADGRHREATLLLERALAGSPSDDVEPILRSLLATELAATDDIERAAREIDLAARLVHGRPADLATLSVLSRAALLTFSLPDRSASESVPYAEACLEAAETLGIDSITVRVRALVATSHARAGNTEAAVQALERLETDAAQRPDDAAAQALTITAGLNVVYVAGRNRRHGAIPWVARALTLLRAHPQAISGDLGTWTIFALMQLGRYEEAEAVLDEFVGHEGYEAVGALVIRARLRWLQGRLDEATRLVREAASAPRDRYWLSNICSVAAEVGAAEGRLTDVRAAVARMAHELPQPEMQPLHLAVLRPLVHAEVDAALAATGDDRQRHVARANEAVARMRTITADRTGSATTQLELATTFLSMAEAELARLDDDPTAARSAWTVAADLADTAWYRDYCTIRIEEAAARAAP